MMEVLKLLPRTNCKECGEPTCMVFAVRLIEGAKDQDNCPPLQEDKREELKIHITTCSIAALFLRIVPVPLVSPT
jgi:ArsR family metal-binding transcriptional regulator